MEAQRAVLQPCGSGRSHSVTLSPMWGSPLPGSCMPAATIRQNASSSRRLRVLGMAISRQKKQEVIDKVKQQLEDCYLVAGVSYKNLTCKQMQDLRRQLPETTKFMVAKNTLVEKAIEGTKWEALKPCLQGMNAWMFIHSEEIPAAIKPYRSFQKALKLEENDFTGGVFEGKYYGPDEFKQLETMPTRAEVYGKLLGVLQAPASKTVGVIQAPARKLLLTLKAYVQKLEDEAASK